jgi:DNA-binding NtrC family response regulator
VKTSQILQEMRDELIGAIIASGYAKTKEVEAAQKSGAGKYIKKSYTLEKFGVAVKEELEK